jgi:hypothetical protein
MKESGMEESTFIYRAAKNRGIGRVNEEIWTKYVETRDGLR